MNVKGRIEKLERTRQSPDGSAALPLHVLTIIMQVGDNRRPFTPAERRELDRYADAIARIVNTVDAPQGQPDQ